MTKGTMPHRRLPRLVRPVAVAVAAAALFCMAAAPPAAQAQDTPDWMHVLYTAAYLKTSPPDTPLVILLGGSSGRECTISDESWSQQLSGLAGVPVTAYNFGSRTQSYAKDLWLLDRLPRVPLILVIGVNLGRYTRAPGETWATEPAPYTTYKQHLYTASHILSVARKKERVRTWLQIRYPIYKRNYTYDVGLLQKLIKRSLAYGFHPVLLDLPRDLAIIGHALDVPIKRYKRDTRAFATAYGIQSMNFVNVSGLVNRDFYDFSHLVEPGRVKWQTALSERTVKVLQTNGLLPTPEPAPEPSSSESPSPAP